MTADKKPRIYRVNGKWYCQRRYGHGFVRTALGVARSTPVEAFDAWYECYKDFKPAVFGVERNKSVEFMS